MNTFRWIFSLTLATGITLLLFYFMQHLVANSGLPERPLQVVKVVDATMPEIELVLDTPLPPPEPIPVVEIVPPELTREHRSEGPAIPLPPTQAAPEIFTGEGLPGRSDGAPVILVSVHPTYPTRAMHNGTEGWCEVSFTITEEGGVSDPFVIGAEPERTFDRSCLAAIQRFRYQPRIEDGRPMEVHDVRYRFRFVLEE